MRRALGKKVSPPYPVLTGMPVNDLKLLPQQDVCLFCAFQYAFRPQAPARSFLIQRRAYQSSASSRRPAAAAALRIDEEDDGPSPPGRELLGWKCACTHVNKPRRSDCTVCLAPRPQRPPLVYKGDNAPSPPLAQSVAQSVPQNGAPPNPTIGGLPRLTPQSSNIRPAESPQSISENILGQIGKTPLQDSRGFAGRFPNTSSARVNGQQLDAAWTGSRHRRGTANEPNIKLQVPPGTQFSQPMGQQFTGFRKVNITVNESGGSAGPRSRHQNGWDRTLGPASDARSDMWNQRDRGMQNGGSDGRFQQRGFQERVGRADPQSQQPRRDDKPVQYTPFGGPPRQREFLDQGAGTEERFTPQQSRFDNRYGQRERSGFDSRARFTPREQFPDRGGSQWRAVDPGFNRAGQGARYDLRNHTEPGTQETRDADLSGEIEIGGIGIGAVDDADLFQSSRKRVAAKDAHRRSRIYEIEETDEPMPAFQNSAIRGPATRARRSRSGDIDEEDSYTSKSARMSKNIRKRSIWNNENKYEAFKGDETESSRNEQRKNKAAMNNGQGKSSNSVRPEVYLPEFISVEKLAQALKVRLDPFIAQLEEEGFEGARYDHILDASTSAMFADLYGFEPIISTAEDAQDLVARPAPEDPSVLPPRPPIVTIMGHVDHGKTTILDYLRKSSVVASEHGGITQHIGAFSVIMPGSERKITFLDTPGHAAFLDMRRRGANVTDIVVLVVAADDGVMPQTIEAIKHAREANVQIIVAINKVDKEDANVERVKQDLSRHDIVVEDYGGDYQAIPVSGKTGKGMADLEEAITLLADVADFRAETDGPVEGWIIESKVTTAGRVATVLVRRGTLKPGDFIVAGTTWARVRTLKNDAGQYIEEAPPGTPVQVDGWRGADPDAGLEVLQADTEHHAKEVVDLRVEKAEAMRATTEVAALNVARSEEADARARVLEWEREQGFLNVGYKLRPKDNEGWIEKESGGPQRVHFVIKADVAGSCEALVHAVSAIGNNEIVANVIHSGVGELRESDIKMLAATGELGYAISFNQSVENSIRRLAEVANLQIMDHNIIYKVTDDVTDKLSAALPPLVSQRVLGEAEVGQMFDITVKKKVKRIAGCRVTNGTISRSHSVRVLRNGEVVYTGK